jgi:hypothetical protein
MIKIMGRVAVACSFLIVGSMLFSPLEPVVILVHGSFASGKDWWKPQGEFFKTLEHQAQQIGQTLVPFGWSGTPTEAEIKSSAVLLAKLIASYPKTETIILIGHSHGGNVINRASQILFEEQQHLSGLDLAATTKVPEKSNNVENALKQAEPVKHYLIDRAYALGTPVDKKKFYPNMQIIGRYISLYSKGDKIQKVAGLYERYYSLQERLTNFEVLMKEKGKDKLVSPGHADLHDVCIARWLLFVPDELVTMKVGGFENFRYAANGKVIFDKEGSPRYEA